ncbi:hypothetical protein [Lentibacillus daqui]|nr:hypothetical protein [Lentibacillus daqui]
MLFVINKNSWPEDELTGVYVFLFVFAEPASILLSIISCFSPDKMAFPRKMKWSHSKEEWIGFGIAVVGLSLFSLIFLGAGVPWPSTIVFLMLMTNAMFALYSILFHPITIGLYRANVYDKKETIADYIFKYIAICFSGVNYYIQLTLLRLPLLINKLFAIVFALILIWQAFTVIGVFNL